MFRQCFGFEAFRPHLWKKWRWPAYRHDNYYFHKSHLSTLSYPDFFLKDLYFAHKSTKGCDSSPLIMVYYNSYLVDCSLNVFLPVHLDQHVPGESGDFPEIEKYNIMSKVLFHTKYKSKTHLVHFITLPCAKSFVGCTDICCKAHHCLTIIKSLNTHNDVKNNMREEII